MKRGRIMAVLAAVLLIGVAAVSEQQQAPGVLSVLSKGQPSTSMR